MDNLIKDIQTSGKEYAINPDDFKLGDIPEIEAPEIESPQPEEQVFSNTDELAGPPTEQQKGTIGAENAAKTAKVMCSLFDMLLSKSCSAYSGLPSNNYTLTTAEKNHLTSNIEDYIKTINFDLSPGKLLIITVAIISSSMFYKANEDRQEKQKRNSRKIEPSAKETYIPEPVQKSKEPKKPEIKPEIKEADWEFKLESYQLPPSAKEAKAEKKQVEITRRKYQIDSNGFYIYDQNGARLKAEDRNERPNDEVQFMLRLGYKNGEIIKELKK